jgi:hypothetical protein
LRGDERTKEKATKERTKERTKPMVAWVGGCTSKNPLLTVKLSWLMLDWTKV